MNKIAFEAAWKIGLPIGLVAAVVQVLIWWLAR
jgi:low affinity Fe/Cu permease